MSSELPRPGKVLTASAFLGVFLALAFLASSLGLSLASTQELKRFEVRSAVFIGATLFFAIQQYRGVFRRTASASRAAGASLVLLIALWSLGLFRVVAEMISGKMPVGNTWWMVAWLAMFGAAPILAMLGLAWMNLSWASRLRTALSQAPELVGSRTFSLREFMLLFTVAVLTIALAGWIVRRDTPSFAENVAAKDVPMKLPDGATEVSYFMRREGSLTQASFVVCEFNTNEAAFRAWVESHVVPLDPKPQENAVREIPGFAIDRYRDHLEDLPRGERGITVPEGIGYSFEYGENSRWAGAAFDRTENRGYYSGPIIKD